MIQSLDELRQTELALPEERAQLVRLCAHLTGDQDAAEDIAQETLLAAWRNMHKLEGPHLRTRWLAGIARNLCLHWSRQRGRELHRYTRITPGRDGQSADDKLASDFDLERDLERAELARLLEKALAHLPPATRSVIVAHYIWQESHAGIAAHLGVTVDAVEARLRRGKQMLRRILTGELHDEASAFANIHSTETRWHETRIWCPSCGQHRLLMQRPGIDPAIAFTCPACTSAPHIPATMYRLTNSAFTQLFSGLTSPRAILNRGARWVCGYFHPAIATGSVTCSNCGRVASLRISRPEDRKETYKPAHFVYVHCGACDEAVSTSFRGLVQCLPEVQTFWRNQARIRVLPERAVEAEGYAAIVSSYESITGAARLTIVTRRDRFQVLRIYPEPREGVGDA